MTFLPHNRRTYSRGGMFSELRFADRRTKTTALLISGALHLGYILFLFVSRPAPIFVRPQLLALGNGAASKGAVYLAFEKPATTPRTPASVRVPKQALPKTDKGPVFEHQERTKASAAEAAQKTQRAGSTRGTLMEGLIAGRDVRPGYPIQFPDPPIDRAKLPPEIQGDVIVEVTIDEQGTVTEARLLQGVGYGIDELIVATLKHWRYKPATMDGTPIASKHDVHYHFPS
jgi:TonB family protein